MPLERLIDEVWGDDPPPSAAHTLESYVSRLRQLLNGLGPILSRRGAGYAIDLHGAQLDALAFVELQESAALASALDEHANVLELAVRRSRHVAGAGARGRRPCVGRPRGSGTIRGAPPAHVRDALRRRARARSPRAGRSGSCRHSSRRTRIASASSHSSCSRSTARAGTPRRSTPTRGPGGGSTTTSGSSRARTCSSCRVRSSGRIPLLKRAVPSATGRNALVRPEGEATTGGACSSPPPRSSGRRSCSRRVEGPWSLTRWRRTLSGWPSSCRSRRTEGVAASGLSIAVDSRGGFSTTSRRRSRTSILARRRRACERRCACFATGVWALSSRSGAGPTLRPSRRSFAACPRRGFVFVDASLSDLSLDGVPNAAAIRFAEEDVLLLGGYASGLMPTMDGSARRIDRVSIVAGAADRQDGAARRRVQRGLRETNPGRDRSRRLLARARGPDGLRAAREQADRRRSQTSWSPSRAGAGSARSRWRGSGACGPSGPRRTVSWPRAHVLMCHGQGLDSRPSSSPSRGSSEGALPMGRDTVLGLEDDYAAGVGSQRSAPRGDLVSGRRPLQPAPSHQAQGHLAGFHRNALARDEGLSPARPRPTGPSRGVRVQGLLQAPGRVA